MSYFLDTLRALWTTAKTLFRKPTTVHFPAEVRERGPRFRASFALLHDENDEELCIGCLMCERICPSDVITVTQGKKRESPATGKKRGWADDLTLDLNACIFCELCVQVCPPDALVMVRAPEVPGFSREDLFLSMERLYENETLRESSWATGSLLMEMQDPKRGQPKPAKKAPAKKLAPKKEVKQPGPGPVKHADAGSTAAADAAAEKKAEPAAEEKKSEPAAEKKAEPAAEEKKAEPAAAEEKKAEPAAAEEKNAEPATEEKEEPQ